MMLIKIDSTSDVDSRPADDVSPVSFRILMWICRQVDRIVRFTWHLLALMAATVIAGLLFGYFTGNNR